jgi:hypothetical protein
VNNLLLQALSFLSSAGLNPDMKICHAERSEASRQFEAFLKKYEQLRGFFARQKQRAQNDRQILVGTSHCPIG